MPSTIGIVASGASAFSPLSLPNLVAWWDASDASTFTYSSGTSVSQWNDKSGNNYHLVQSTGLNQPSRSGTINSLNTVVFDGSNDFLSVASFNMSASQKFSIGHVATSTGAGFQAVIEQNSFNAAGDFTNYKESGSALLTVAKRGTASLRSFFTNNSAIFSTTPRVFVATHDGTLSTDETTSWFNNVATGTRPINNDTNSVGSNATTYVGSRGGTSLYLNGQIAELVICSTNLSTADRTSLQTYMASKWGITL